MNGLKIILFFIIIISANSFDEKLIHVYGVAVIDNKIQLLEIDVSQFSKDLFISLVDGQLYIMDDILAWFDLSTSSWKKIDVHSDGDHIQTMEQKSHFGTVNSVWVYNVLNDKWWEIEKMGVNYAYH